MVSYRIEFMAFGHKWPVGPLSVAEGWDLV